MSNTVDQRVVQMQFDNKQFENNVGQSMSTLEKLKQALKFDQAATGFQNITNAAKGVTMTALSTAVEQVGSSFSAMEVMGITALANITNSAVNAGKNIVSALTVEPVMTGFNEYETKINSIQTIMSNTASKGTTMDDVIKTIDELNTYADKTIYNFAEMTRNIGTFTAAGVALEPASKAIQGIANLAAASGSSSLQASTAMYQLSQALATGTVRLMDWNSVVNAGMGGELFQEALKKTAREHGVAVDEMITKNGSFRESLQDGWLSADILNETLNKFTVDGAKKYAQSMIDSGQYTQEQADALIREAQAMEDAATKVKTFTQLWSTLKESAQSGWGKTWEIIIGDFDEAKYLFSNISDVLGGMIARSADSRNELLSMWKTFGGRDVLFDGIRIMFDDIMVVVDQFKSAMSDVFPPITYENLLAFSAAFKALAYDLRLSDDNAAKVKDVFSGVFSAIDLVVKGISNLIGVSSPGISVLSNFAQSALDFAASVGRWLTELDKGYKGFENVGKAATHMETSVTTAVSSVDKTVKNSGLEPLLTSLQSAFSQLGDVVGITSGNFSDMALNFETIAKVLSALFVGGIGFAFVKFIMGLVNPLTILNSIGNSVAESFKQVTEVIKGFQMQLKAKALLTIAIAIGILAASLFLLSAIDTDKLVQSMIALTILFVELIAGMKILSMMNLNIKGALFKNIAMMIAMATAILLLSFALKNIADLDWEQLARGLIGITVLLAAMTGVLLVLAKGKGEILEGALTIAAFAGAVQILVGAVKEMANLSWEQLAKGLLGVSVLLGVIVLVSEKMKVDDSLAKIGLGLIIMAVGVKILASAVKDLGALDTNQLIRGLIGLAGVLFGLTWFVSNDKLSTDLLKIGAGVAVLAMGIRLLADAVRDMAGLSWEELIKGLGGVGALLYGISAFSKANATIEIDLIKIGAGVVVMAIGIKILASAVRDLAGLDTAQLIQGLIGVGALLAGLAIFAKTKAFNTDLIIIGAGLLLTAIALNILAGAVTTLGNLNGNQITSALIAIGGSLVILAIGLEAMSGTLMGSAALLVASLAIAVLVPSLLLLSTVNLERLGISLVAIAGALAIFGVAAAVLTPIMIPLLALSAAFLIIAVSAVLFATACYIAASSISVLADGLAKLGSLSPETIGQAFESIKTILDSVSGIVPSLLSAIVAGITAMAQAVIQTAPVIATAILTVLGQVLAGFGTLLPQIATLFMQLLTTLCQVILQGLPMIAQTFLQLILSLLDVLTTNIPLLIQAGVDLITALLLGIATAIPQLVDAGFQSIIAFVNGLADAIRSNTQPMIDAFNNLFSAMAEAGYAVLMNAVGQYMNAGQAIMNNGLVSGIMSMIGNLVSTISGGIQSAYDAVVGFVDSFFSVGSNIISGLVSGIQSGIDWVTSAARDVATAAYNAAASALQVNSPSKKFEYLGHGCDEGTAKGFYKGAGLVTTAAKQVAIMGLDAASNTMSKLGGMIMNAIDAQPTIKPVMDLTSIQNGVSTMDQMIGSTSVKMAADAKVTTSSLNNQAEMVDSVVSSIMKKLTGISDGETVGSNNTLEVPVYIDGREVARATSKHLDNFLGFKTGLAERGMVT